jgi:hypothetical protein
MPIEAPDSLPEAAAFGFLLYGCLNGTNEAQEEVPWTGSSASKMSVRGGGAKVGE